MAIVGNQIIVTSNMINHIFVAGIVGGIGLFHSYVPPEEIRGFDNSVVRRKPKDTTGENLICDGEWVQRHGFTVIRMGCPHLMYHHDSQGCLWEACNCGEVP